MNLGGGFSVQGLKEFEATSLEDTKRLLELGKKNRQTYCTAANSDSSRSHSILLLKLYTYPKDCETFEEAKAANLVQFLSKMLIVDLAGSERSSKTNTEGERLREANTINTSLLAFGRFIEAIKYNQTHRVSQKNIPIRDSKLTMVLWDCLNGGKATMIVNINPASRDYDETLQVLRFSALAKEIKISTKTEMGITPRKRRIGEDHTESEVAYMRAFMKSEKEKSDLQRELDELKVRLEKYESVLGRDPEKVREVFDERIRKVEEEWSSRYAALKEEMAEKEKEHEKAMSEIQTEHENEIFKAAEELSKVQEKYSTLKEKYKSAKESVKELEIFRGQAHELERQKNELVLQLQAAELERLEFAKKVEQKSRYGTPKKNNRKEVSPEGMDVDDAQTERKTPQKSPSSSEVSDDDIFADDAGKKLDLQQLQFRQLRANSQAQENGVGVGKVKLPISSYGIGGSSRSDKRNKKQQSKKKIICI